MCYNLSDEACEDELQENITVRNFCRISDDSEIPDHTTLWRFEQLLTEHNLQEKLFAEQVNTLIIGGKIVKKGTLVDSSIIETSTSKRNKSKTKDESSSWTKKAGNYKHGKKIHVGVDDDSGLIHSAVATPANEHDLHSVEACLHGDEAYMVGDSGYLVAENHSKKASNMNRHIMKRRSSVKKLPPRQQELQRRHEQAIASRRAKVEHVFGVIKGRFGWRRERKWGMTGFEASLFMRCVLANIYKLSRMPRRN